MSNAKRYVTEFIIGLTTWESNHARLRIFEAAGRRCDVDAKISDYHRSIKWFSTDLILAKKIKDSGETTCMGSWYVYEENVPIPKCESEILLEIIKELESRICALENRSNPHLMEY